MKIAIVANKFWPDATVGSKRISAWAWFWADRFQDEILVLARRYPGLEVQNGEESPPSSLRIKHLQSGDAAPEGRIASAHVPRWKRQASKLFVPDGSIAFWRRNQDAALAELAEFHPDALVTTSPPHATHSIGLASSRKIGIPWVADFRDAYLGDPAYGLHGLRVLRRNRHKAFELSVYAVADLIVHTHEIHHQLQERKYSFARDRMLHVPNGVPSDAFCRLSRRPPVAQGNAIAPRVLVLGNSGRGEALGLLNGISRLGGSISLTYAGLNSEMYTTADGGHHRVLGLVGHSRALQEIANADVLAIPQSPDRIGRLSSTSKIPEFMASGRPILIANPQQNDLLILRRYYEGFFAVVSPGDSASAWQDALGWATCRTRHEPTCAQRDAIVRAFDRGQQASIVRSRIQSLVFSGSA